MSKAGHARRAPTTKTPAIPGATMHVGRPGDGHEREADRLADRVLRMPADRQGVRGRGAPMEERPAADSSTTDVGPAPPSVREVLSSAGQPLDASARAFFEPRFGHDFGGVRIHADVRAARSTRRVHASGYAVGEHVVLGDGRAAGRAPGGDRLLAHELAHVVQHRRDSTTGRTDGPPRSPILRRQSLPDFVRATFTRDELEAYVQGILGTDHIEGGLGSDNKARAYVTFAQTSLQHYAMSPRLRTLLILELLDGTVTVEDQDAILTILESSRLADYGEMFGPGGVSDAALIAGVTDAAHAARLNQFLARRTGEVTGEAARQQAEQATQRLERAIGDFEKAARDNRRFATSGPRWEAKLATVRDGQYSEWADLWANGDDRAFALKVASFQSALGVPEDDIDGVLGPQTWARLAGLGEAVAGVERVEWAESETTCTLAARERLFRGYRMATGESVAIPEGKSEAAANWILHSRSERMKDLPLEYRATGSAGLAVYLGLGEFVSEADIWNGLLEPGAVLQVWGSRRNYDLMRTATTTGETFYGTNFVFVRYDTETTHRMLTRHMGRDEWMSKDEYEVWIAANMRTLDTGLPPP